MNLIVHAKGDISLKSRLETDAVLHDHKAIVFIPDKRGLIETLQQSLIGETALLYFLLDETDLTFLRVNRELLFSVKLIFILSSYEKRFVTSAYSFRPRLILYREIGADAIAGIVLKMGCSELNNPVHAP